MTPAFLRRRQPGYLALCMCPSRATFISLALFASCASPRANTTENSTLNPIHIHEAFEAAEACLHWAGEEPYSRQRGLEIAQAAEQACKRADALLSIARGSGLTPQQDALLTVALGNASPELCALIPLQSANPSLAHDEATAKCEPLRSPPAP